MRKEKMKEKNRKENIFDNDENYLNNKKFSSISTMVSSSRRGQASNGNSSAYDSINRMPNYKQREQNEQK
jgi:hypothetical protein